MAALVVKPSDQAKVVVLRIKHPDGKETVVQGPEGALYLLTDDEGELIKVTPATTK